MGDVTDNNALRPRSLKEYVGQAGAVKTLEIFLEAAKQRGTVSEHILFYGPPGIGKTTLSHIIAHELRGEIRITSGAAMQKPSDLAAILTNLKDNDVFFIDEIHRLPRAVEEMLYPVLEEYFLDIVIGKGPAARTVRLPVPRITIIGATTKLANISAPLRDRFGLLLRLEYYTDEEMTNIVLRTAQQLEITVTQTAAYEIARRARKTPRLANRIVRRARDYIQVEEHSELNDTTIERLFSLLDIDAVGLTDIDLQYLRLIADKYQNSPVGIETIASALSEDRRTIEEFVEPYLLQLGFIKKTAKGRVLTQRALDHLKGSQQHLI